MKLKRKKYLFEKNKKKERKNQFKEIEKNDSINVK